MTKVRHARGPQRTPAQGTSTGPKERGLSKSAKGSKRGATTGTRGVVAGSPTKRAPQKVGLASERRDRERIDRIAWILDGALEIAVDKGIGAVTITALADRLGYTVGAFYRYFPSLDALLAALHRRTAEIFYGSFFEALGPARERLAELSKDVEPRAHALAEVALLLEIFRRLADAYPRYFELIAQLVTQETPWLDATAQLSLQQLVLPRVHEIMATVARAQAIGALDGDNPVLRTMTIWLGAHAALSVGPLSRKRPELFNRDALFAEMLRSLLRGGGAAPADVEVALRLARQAGTS